MRFLILGAALLAAPAFAQDAPKPTPEQIAVQACIGQRDEANNKQIPMMVEITTLRARVAELEAKAKGGK
jgi:hypothetical protein